MVKNLIYLIHSHIAMAKQKGTPRQWQEKVCPRCGIKLTKDNHSPRYLKVGRYNCKECIRGAARKYYHKHKEKRRGYYREHYQKHKEEILKKSKDYYQRNKEKISSRSREHYQKVKGTRVKIVRKGYKLMRLEKRKRALEILGNKCIYCGCDDFSVLEINHKNGRNKGISKRSGSNTVRDILNGKADLDELETTCAVCNIWHYYTKLKNVPNKWTITWE